MEIARAWAQALREGDLGERFWHPELVIENAEGWVLPVTYRGHEGLHRWWHDLSEAFSEFAMLVDEIEPVDEERLLTSQRFVGTFRETGLPLDGPWSSVLTVRDGLIVHAVGYLSKGQALRALATEARSEPA